MSSQCGFPHRRFWYVSAPPLDSIPQASLKLMSVVNTTPGRKNFTFFLTSKTFIVLACISLMPFTFSPTTAPPRASIFISPHREQILTSWSLEDFVPPSLPCNDMEPQGPQCHFIFYCRGAGNRGETFWLELEVCVCLVYSSMECIGVCTCVE